MFHIYTDRVGLHEFLQIVNYDFSYQFIYESTGSELYNGIVGRGAWINEKRIKVSATVLKKKAVLCTGFPINTDFTPNGIRRFVKQVRSYKKVRLLGSAALSLAYVAAGRADAYQENNIMLWDIAAGIPILLGARGKVEIKKAKKSHSFYVFASAAGPGGKR